MRENSQALELAILEARLEGLSLGQICEMVGKGERYVRKILAKENVQIELEKQKNELEANLKDVRLREVHMREKANELVLGALNGEMGVEKQFDAAKVVFKAQKIESGIQDATKAFREFFQPGTGDAKPDAGTV